MWASCHPLEHPCGLGRTCLSGHTAGRLLHPRCSIASANAKVDAQSSSEPSRMRRPSALAHPPPPAMLAQRLPKWATATCRRAACVPLRAARVSARCAASGGVTSAMLGDRRVCQISGGGTSQGSLNDVAVSPFDTTPWRRL